MGCDGQCWSNTWDIYLNDHLANIDSDIDLPDKDIAQYRGILGRIAIISAGQDICGQHIDTSSTKIAPSVSHSQLAFSSQK